MPLRLNLARSALARACSSFERGLTIHCAIHRLDHTGELGKNAIAGRVHETAVVLLD
jgi:hypothetical protein